MDQIFEGNRISQADAKEYNSENLKHVTPVKVQYSEKMDPDALYYDLTDKGLAVIFNHTQFYNNRLPKRLGTWNDVIRLEKCLKNLNFSCKMYDDCAIADIQKIMEIVADLSTTEFSCIIVVVLTHGTPQKLAAYDVDYNKSLLYEKLVGKLVGIPKLFFIQACRGKRVDKGIEVTDSFVQKTDDEARFTLPEMADFLFMYSTYKGYVSWREETGSWFIQSLSEVFEEKSKEWDLLQMLTYVCKKVAIKYESKTIDESTNKTKSIPQIVSTLTKFLKFNVKSIKNKDATCNKNKDSKCNKTKHSSVVSYRLYMLVLYKFLFHYLCMKYSN